MTVREFQLTARKHAGYRISYDPGYLDHRPMPITTGPDRTHCRNLHPLEELGVNHKGACLACAKEREAKPKPRPKGDETRCPNGHLWETAGRSKRGQCLECKRIWKRRSDRKKQRLPACPFCEEPFEDNDIPQTINCWQCDAIICYACAIPDQDIRGEHLCNICEEKTTS